MLSKEDEILVIYELRDHDGMLTVVTEVENAAMPIINTFERPIDVNMKVKLRGIAFFTHSC